MKFRFLQYLRVPASVGLRSSVLALLLLLAFALIPMRTAYSGDSASPRALPGLSSEVPNELKGIGIEEHLGSAVTLADLSFRDEQGNPVKLSHYFSAQKPVILTLVYYECPNLCNFMLNGLLESMRQLTWTAGKEFEIVTVSINPREGPALAAQKKAAYLREYGRPEAAAGWHFLTGDEPQIRRLATEVGFRYRYDEREKQYAHAAAFFVLTPQGKLSRYLYGISFAPKDVRLALLEASDGKIGTVIDRLLLFCYRYNLRTRKYSVYLTQLMQAGGAGTVLVFGGYLAVFWRKQRNLTASLTANKERQGG